MRLNYRLKLTLISLGVFSVVLMGVFAVVAKNGYLSYFADEVITQNINITVRDESGDPQLGALVSIKNISSSWMTTASTNLNGEISMPVPFGRYNFTASAPPNFVGYLENQQVSRTSNKFVIVISNDDEVDPETVTIKGRVIDADSKTPISGASVKTDKGNYSVITDTNGNYQIVVPVDKYWLTASKTNYKMTISNYSVGDLVPNAEKTVEDIWLVKNNNEDAPITDGDTPITDTDSFDVAGNIASNTEPAEYLEADVTLQCNYTMDTQRIFRPADIQKSKNVQSKKNGVGYNFYFETVPKKYNNADLEQCYLSFSFAEGSLYQSPATQTISYTSIVAQNKIGYFNPWKKEAAYFLKINANKKTIQQEKVINFSGKIYSNYIVTKPNTKFEKEWRYPISTEIEFVINSSDLNIDARAITISNEVGSYLAGNIKIPYYSDKLESEVELNIKIGNEYFEYYSYKTTTKLRELYANTFNHDISLIPKRTIDEFQICAEMNDTSGAPLSNSQIWAFIGDKEELNADDFIKYYQNRITILPWVIEYDNVLQDGKWVVYIKNYPYIGKNPTPSLPNNFSVSLFATSGVKKIYQENNSILMEGGFPNNIRRITQIKKSSILLMNTSAQDGNCITSIAEYNNAPVLYNDYEINFFDAFDGRPVNVYEKIVAKQVIIDMGFMGWDNFKHWYMLGNESIQTNARKSNQVVMKIPSGIDFGYTKIIKYYEFLNNEEYMMLDSDIDVDNSVFPINVYLAKISQINEALPCLEFNQINFCMMRYPIYGKLTNEQKENINKISIMLSGLRKLVSDNAPVSVYVQTSPFDRAYARNYIDMNFNGHSIIASGKNMLSISLNSINNFEPEELFRKHDENMSSFIHEYFHTLDYNRGVSEKDIYRFENITINGNTEEARRIMIANSCCESDLFPNFSYTADTNNRELWAEFTTWWYLHNDEFQAAIADTNTSISEPCKQVLKFMYAVLQAEYPDITPYQKSSTETGLAKDTEIALYKQEANLAVLSNLPDTFDSIMQEAGYSKVKSMPSFTPISSLATTIFKQSQILNGSWQKSEYQTSSTKEKVLVQMQIFSSKIIYANFKAGSLTLKNRAVEAYNNFYNSLLKSLNLFKNTGRVSIRIVDENNAGIGSMLIVFANKVCITDEYGMCTINDIIPGEYQLLSVQDSDTSLKYTAKGGESSYIVYPSRRTVVKKTIEYKHATITGKVVDKYSKPLRKVKVIFKGKYSGKSYRCFTDSEGVCKISGLNYEPYEVSVSQSFHLFRVNKINKIIQPIKSQSESEQIIYMSKIF